MRVDQKILLCTVGGAHQPILKAIDSASPTYVCFFCTDQDPETGKPGSIVQITGKGNVIKAAPADKKPTLPNIPTQAKLDQSEFALHLVPADDLDGAYFAIRNAVEELEEQFPEAQLEADYTGGTKTMTAALVCAALQRGDMELQLVAGARPNLGRVEDGTEQAMAASVATLRLERAMAPYLDAWRRFAYAEAAEGLRQIRVATNSPGRKQLALAVALSRAFARWDSFDHQGAVNVVRPYASRIRPLYPTTWQTLDRLTTRDATAHEAARLFDLWLNAERRATQGRYDDAIARWYRLMEWTAQWQLRIGRGVETADFPPELLPPDVDAVAGRDGKIKIGLWSAWQAVEHLVAGPTKAFMAEHGSKLRDLLDLRNNSMLAHGFRPVTSADWHQVSSWTQENFLPVLKNLAANAGLKHEPAQLPNEPPSLPVP